MDERLSDLSHLDARPAAVWRDRGWWGQMPLWQRVQRRAHDDPSGLAVVDEAGTLTAEELWADALAVCKALRGAGLGRGDIVLVQVPNWREFAVVATAIEAAGAVLGFCPVTWGTREAARGLDLLKPKIWFLPGNDPTARLPWLAEALERATHRPDAIVALRSARIPAAEAAGPWTTLESWTSAADSIVIDPAQTGGRGLDPLEIAVTSGTTGDPKGVLHLHDTALATVQTTVDRQQIGPQDTVHVAIPIGHTFGYFYGVRCALQSGARLLLQEKWDAKRAAHLIQQHRATVSLGPAACLIDLMALDEKDRQRLSPLRLFTQSGDALPRSVAVRAIASLPFRISRALGMTEFGHIASTDADSPEQTILETAGSPQPGITIEIRDRDGVGLPPGAEGRVFVAGPALFAGYIRPDRLDPDVLDARGFFETGDLGFIGEDGYLRITGREKNIIRRGAVTIPTAEVENALASHPSVAHAVLLARPDERLGEVPAACLQLRPDCPAPSLGDIGEHLASLGMTRAFWPDELLTVTVWPLGPTGKIDREELLRRLQESRSV